MTLVSIFKRLEKVVIDNSPTLLAGAGIAGVVITAYLTGTASYKAAELLQDEEDLDLRETVERTWRLYIPAVLAGTATISAVAASSAIAGRRYSALSAAYVLTDRAYQRFVDGVERTGGPRSVEKARTSAAESGSFPASTALNPDKGVHRGTEPLVVVGTTAVPCVELYTGRTFQSSVEDLRRAETDIRFQLVNDGYASLGDFYRRVGLGETAMDEEVGWTSESPIELKFTSHLLENGVPCLAVDYRVAPIRKYWKVG